jgi:hypothetical protein
MELHVSADDFFIFPFAICISLEASGRLLFVSSSFVTWRWYLEKKQLVCTTHFYFLSFFFNRSFSLLSSPLFCMLLFYIFFDSLSAIY